MTQVIDVPRVEPDPAAIDPRIRERREEVARAAVRRRLRVALVVGAVVVVGAGTWITLHSAVLAARHVTVIGAIHTGVGPVVAAVGLDGQPLVDVNPGAVAARVEALPWVAHATVTRHWPDDITVTVVERVAAAVAESPGQGPVLVDGTGHVLAPAPVIPPDTVVIDTPVAPGRPGSVLGPAAGPGLAALAAVPPLLQARIERIYVADDGDVSVALTGNIGAVLGPAAELPAKFQALLSVLVDVPPTAPEDVDVTVPGAPAVGPAVALEGPVLPTPAPAGSPAGTRAGARAPGGTTAAGSGAPQVRREGRGPS